MDSIEHVVEIDLPADQVYAFVTDPEQFPRWQKDVTSVRCEGTTFVTTRRIGRAERHLTQEVVEDEPPWSWSAQGVDGPLRPDARVRIEPLDDGSRSRVTFTLDFRATGIGRGLLPVVRKMVATAAPQSYRNLKELLEGGAS